MPGTHAYLNSVRAEFMAHKTDDKTNIGNQLKFFVHGRQLQIWHRSDKRTGVLYKHT